MSHDDSRAARQSTEVLHLTEAEVAVHSGTKHPEGEVSKSTMPEMTKIVLHAVPSLAQTAQGDKAQSVPSLQHPHQLRLLPRRKLQTSTSSAG